MSKVLCIEDLCHRYDQKQILNNFNLSLNKGECVSLLGASGCGKTSVLRAVAGLLDPDEGRIVLSGKEIYSPNHVIPPRQRNVGLVFQDYALFPHLTVIDNIAFGLHGQDRLKIDKRCHELLVLTGLLDHGHKKPNQLSGGQQQRVALARALAPKPSLLLLDEPFANIDSNLKLNLGQALKDILRKESATALLVTHDRNDALMLSDRIAVMNQSERGGYIEQIGDPETIYRRPISASTAMLTGEVLVFEAIADNGVLNSQYGDFESIQDIEGEVFIIERPESFLFSLDSDGPFKATAVYFYGGSKRVELVDDSGRWLAQCPPNVEVGDRLSMSAVHPLWAVQR